MKITKIFRQLNIAKAIFLVATLVIITLLLLMVAIPFIFGLDDDMWDIQKGDVAKISHVRNDRDYINLGEVSYEYTEEYNGELYDGYNDPVQKAMARELLELYKGVVRKQQSLLAKGIDEQSIIETILGTHLGEVDTYSYKEYRSLNENDKDSKKPTRTYIPLTFVKWSDYGTARTVEGLPMNFTNYNWRDFEKRYKSENPTNEYLGTKSGNYKYEDGFNYSLLRSETGAIGPLQMQPETWKNNRQYLQGGEYSSSNPVQIMDIENYIKSDYQGRNTDFNGDGYGDIFNLGDLALANVEWQDSFYEESGDGKTSFGVDVKDTDLIRMYFHYRYYGGSPSSVNDAVLNDWKSIANDSALLKEFHDIYKSKYGHGADLDLIYKAYTDRGWTRNSGGSVTKSIDGENVTLSSIASIHTVRSYFKGKVWYRFLNGIAYGGRPADNNQRTALNKVKYNYMTKEDGTRKISQSVRTEALDERKAIGYKGHIPIYDQTGQEMRNYTMLYPRSDGGTFYDFACTIFAMTSLQHATANPTLPKYHSNVDLDNNGWIDPIEMWGQGRKYHNNSHSGITYDPADTSTIPSGKSINTVVLGNMMSNMGYKVSYAGQGTPDGNADIINRLKNGIPTTIRIDDNRRVRALVPSQDPNSINYNTFDMYDFSKYTGDSIRLANLGHTVLGVEAREINGKDYISIVNSTQHHTTGYDSNLSWFEADDILNDYYPIVYSIVGSTDPNWKPGDNYNVDRDTIGQYMGVTYGEALDAMNNTEYGYINNQEIALTVSESGTVTIDGRYRTDRIDENTMFLYLGELNNTVTVLEISNIDNPRTNNIGDISNNEFTELFDLSVGNRALISIMVIDEEGNTTYDSFYDEVE